jgi:Domain of unknown function (DUF4440)
MKQKIIILMTVLVGFTSAFSQDKSLQKDILVFRESVVKAIKQKDEITLKKMFAEDFTHTHAIGKIDDKQTRLKVLLSGDETIDTVKPDNLSVKTFGKNLAVIQGQTTFQGDQPKIYQWTYVYQKTKGKWQIVLSHASLKTV